MATQNVEVLRRAYEAWNRLDYDALFAVMDPDIELQLPEGGINTGTFKGHGLVRALLDNYLESFEYFRLEPEEFVETDDRILVFVRQSGRGRGSGVEMEIALAHLWTMRAGKAVRGEVFPEREEALRAAGLEGG